MNAQASAPKQEPARPIKNEVIKNGENLFLLNAHITIKGMVLKNIKIPEPATTLNFVFKATKERKAGWERTEAGEVSWGENKK
jgi:hypothetical protein